MKNTISLLDCTLRDGAYITNSFFGTPAIRGIIKELESARIDIIECGWLKDSLHEEGSSFFHIPSDIKTYLGKKQEGILYVAMIDWDRYNVLALPDCDGETIDAIRVVFPHGKHCEAIEVGHKIRERGYKVLFQAANTLAYTDKELMDLADCMNDFQPESLSIVDTFGAMYFDDIDRIMIQLDRHLDQKIAIGFHAHNNQQLAFALSIRFIEFMKETGRNIIIDATLSGMGRGAGNATTELVASYLNRKQHGNYDMNAIMDSIDIYMQGFHERYTWGYSTPYFIAGLYQSHVNNISYLLKNHRTNAKDMRNIIESLTQEERRKYDYDLLEEKYIENQNRKIDDSMTVDVLKKSFEDRALLLIAPGKSADTQEEKIQRFIKETIPVTIAVNAVNRHYSPDYYFFTNIVRYEYAMTAYPDRLNQAKRILLSNIKTEGREDELIVNFNMVIKRGWEHFDNAVILCLRLLNKLNVKNVYLAGFDGFKTYYNESYSDTSLPTLNPDGKWEELNEEIKDMFRDLRRSLEGKMDIQFITESIFDI